jgi:hypothetical protein
VPAPVGPVVRVVVVDQAVLASPLLDPGLARLDGRLSKLSLVRGVSN